MKTPKSRKVGWVLVAMLGAALTLPGTASAFGSGHGGTWDMMMNMAALVEEDSSGNPDGNLGQDEIGGDPGFEREQSEPRSVPAPGAAPLMALGLAGFWAVSYVGRRNRANR